MMGADYYDDQSNGDVPGLGVGDGAQIQDAIIDKNARIGKNVFLSPKGMEEGWADSGRKCLCPRWDCNCNQKWCGCRWG